MKVLYLIICFVSFGQETIRLTTAEYPPYLGENLQRYGLVSEIITETFKHAGYNVELTFFPWIRAEKLATEGYFFDGMLSPWKSKKREPYFYFSDPFLPNEVVFYKLKTFPFTFESFDQLKTISVGLVRGYANPETLEKTIKATYVTNDKDNIQLLLKQRVNLILIDRKVAKYLIGTYFQEDSSSLEAVEPPLEINPQHLALSKQFLNAKVILQRFNQSLQILKKQGHIDHIIKSHGFK